ncbi:MAG: lipoate protein ligase C-terminal domain-containing protein [Candidatus Thermoplasmatota archaeon]
MQARSVYKVPAGKLLKISVDYDEKTFVIKEIGITGDFFAYPEEAIELLETRLKNTVIEKTSLLKKISSVITEYHIQFIGVDAASLTHGILMCKS